MYVVNFIKKKNGVCMGHNLYNQESNRYRTIPRKQLVFQ